MLGQQGEARCAGGSGQLAPGMHQMRVVHPAGSLEVVQVEQVGQQVCGVLVDGASGGKARFGAEVGAAGAQIVEFLEMQGMGGGGFHEAGGDDIRAGGLAAEGFCKLGIGHGGARVRQLFGLAGKAGHQLQAQGLGL